MKRRDLELDGRYLMKNGSTRQVISIQQFPGSVMVLWRDHIGDGWCRDYSFCAAAQSRLMED